MTRCAGRFNTQSGFSMRGAGARLPQTMSAENFPHIKKKLYLLVNVYLLPQTSLQKVFHPQKIMLVNNFFLGPTAILAENFFQNKNHIFP